MNLMRGKARLFVIAGLLAIGLVVLVQFGSLPSLPHKRSHDPWGTGAARATVRVTQAAIPEGARHKLVETYGKLPLAFEGNQGQADPRVKFLSRGKGYSLYLTPTEAVLAIRQVRNAECGMKNSQFR
jgi:hypothetical protein